MRLHQVGPSCCFSQSLGASEFRDLADRELPEIQLNDAREPAMNDESIKVVGVWELDRLD